MTALYRNAIIFSITALVVASCANRQEEAARLEREILSQDTVMSLASITRDSQPLEETKTPTVPSADAIPPSEDLSSATDMSEHSDSAAQAMTSAATVDSVMALVASQTADSTELQSTQAIVNQMSSVETSTPMPRREVTGKFTVQLVASISESYALGLVDLYTRRGYEPYVDMKEISGVRWYRVRVGNFDSMEDAVQTRDALIDKYSLQAWVDNIPQ